DRFRIRAVRAVVHAVAGDGPAVVLPGFGQVELVPAARAVLAFPQPAGARIDRQSLAVAMAVTPDLRSRARPARQRTVGGNAAVQVHAYQLALQFRQVLRQRALEALALADEDVPMAVEREPRAEMVRPVELGLLPIDHAHAGQRVVAQRRA